MCVMTCDATATTAYIHKEHPADTMRTHLWPQLQLCCPACDGVPHRLEARQLGRERVSALCLTLTIQPVLGLSELLDELHAGFFNGDLAPQGQAERSKDRRDKE